MSKNRTSRLLAYAHIQEFLMRKMFKQLSVLMKTVRIQQIFYIYIYYFSLMHLFLIQHICINFVRRVCSSKPELTILSLNYIDNSCLLTAVLTINVLLRQNHSLISFRNIRFFTNPDK